MTKTEYILRYYEKMLWKKHGITDGSRLLYPLKWYLNTGRASADYINRLDRADYKQIMAILEAEGSVEEVCSRLKEYLYR